MKYPTDPRTWEWLTYDERKRAWEAYHPEVTYEELVALELSEQPVETFETSRKRGLAEFTRVQRERMARVAKRVAGRHARK